MTEASVSFAGNLTDDPELRVGRDLTHHDRASAVGDPDGDAAAVIFDVALDVVLTDITAPALLRPVADADPASCWQVITGRARMCCQRRRLRQHSAAAATANPAGRTISSSSIGSGLSRADSGAPTAHNPDGRPRLRDRGAELVAAPAEP
jgi:hypothetical protein